MNLDFIEEHYGRIFEGWNKKDKVFKVGGVNYTEEQGRQAEDILDLVRHIKAQEVDISVISRQIAKSKMELEGWVNKFQNNG